MKATWMDSIIAESDHTIVIEGHHYFPPSALNMEYFIRSETTSECSWKGTASYYTIIVKGKENKDAAWYYPLPKEAASEITGYIAFWKGINIVE